MEQQICILQLLQRGLKRLHQLMGQLADKANRVGDHHIQRIADGQKPRGGIQGIDDNYDVEAMNNSVIWMSAGCIDMAYNNKMGIAATTLMEHYDKLGINYTFDLYTGAHDWGFWRHAISTFAKDYLWKTTSEATLGVTVPEWRMILISNAIVYSQ